jgi:hypothetical protein
MTPAETAKKRPTCFIAMPITTRPAEADLYGDEDHWSHVMESLFVKAIEAAGFEAVRPVAQGAHLIHGQIISHLSRADLVLCDLSSHNPNVFFELGVRTSLNLPIALVRDSHLDLPFDTSGINTHTYSHSLRGWEIEGEKEKLAAHIRDSAASCKGTNPLWRQFGLSIRAQEPDASESPLQAKVDIIADRLAQVQRRLDEDAHGREDDDLLERHGTAHGTSVRVAGFLNEARRLLGRRGLHYSFKAENSRRVHFNLTSEWNPSDIDLLERIARKHAVELFVRYGEKFWLSLPGEDDVPKLGEHDLRDLLPSPVISDVEE